jgi:apolipoprotein N-acyltransferase
LLPKHNAKYRLRPQRACKDSLQKDSAMFSLAEKVILSNGWRRRAIAFGSGAVGALALAPIDFLPAMIVTMTAAVWLIDGSVEWKSDNAQRGFSARSATLTSVKRAFEIGWWWGFGYFVAGLWWLGAAFLVEPDEFAWALPLGVFGLPAYLALFPALGFGLARLLWAPGASRVLVLAGTLGGAEWLRGHLLSGFPWNSFGMALADHLVLAQFASLVGLYGLSVLTVAIFATPAVYADKAAGGKGRPRIILPAPVIAAALVVGGLALFGAWRLSSGSPGLVPGVKLRIMQPNVQQGASFTVENKDAILAHYLALSDRATGPAHSGLADTSVLIWPESAFPFVLSRDPQALAQIGAALPQGTILVTGAARVGEAAAAKPGTSGRAEFFNSIHVISRGGLILDTYDKTHLVPFGEYMPAGRLFERFGLHHFVHIPGGFTPGYMRGALSVPGLPPAAPLICYEAIFPGEVVPPPSAEGTHPSLMLNVTDDAWFGHTAGPHQHFAQARLRTIEEGLPLVRAATTGISAVIDPYGRILAMLPLGEEGILDSGLPEKIAAPPFAHAPVFASLITWLGALFAALALRWSFDI